MYTVDSTNTINLCLILLSTEDSTNTINLCVILLSTEDSNNTINLCGILLSTEDSNNTINLCVILLSTEDSNNTINLSVTAIYSYLLNTVWPNKWVVKCACSYHQPHPPIFFFQTYGYLVPEVAIILKSIAYVWNIMCKSWAV